MHTIHRSDYRTAAVVQMGIALLAQFGTYDTARILAANDVPFAVALRVLTRPESRRAQ